MCGECELYSFRKIPPLRAKLSREIKSYLNNLPLTEHISKVTQTANDKKAYLYHPYKLCGINISLQKLKQVFHEKQ